MQRELVKILKETELTVNEIEDFSDRLQYKTTRTCKMCVGTKTVMIFKLEK